MAPVKIGVLPLSKKLNENAEKVFEELSKTYNCEYDDRGNIEMCIRDSRLPDSVEEKLLKPEYSMKPIVGNEGFKTAGKVQYVARVGNSSEKGLAYNGVNKVLKTSLGYDYLWNEVRVKGGAYGVMCAFTDMGNGYMVSYRDPKDVYKRQTIDSDSV